MQRLTWSENLELLSDPAKAVLEAKEKMGGTAAIDFIGLDAMRGPARKNVADALGEGWRPGDASRVVEALMLHKRPRELEAIRGACAMLDAARGALEKAHRGGASATAAVLEGEHAAHRLGAQDVRTLFSLDGGRTLVPFPGPSEARSDPLQAYFAVRNHGYWADGMMVVPPAPNKALEQAKRALAALLKECRAGAQASALGRCIDETLAPYSRHPVTASEFGNAMGLSMEKGPKLKQGGDERLEEGEVYSVRVGASGQEGHAIVSAMLHVKAQGAQVLWSSLPL
jgi:Xaa-Pro aminopeptidase